jgi:hypothetical protein
MRLVLIACLLVSPAAFADEVDPVGYPWLADADDLVSLEARFAAPEGYSRLRVDPDGWEAWLRGLPLEPRRTTVLAYDGRTLDRPAAAIVRMDVGRGDLQQCADSAIRLHAEFLWASGSTDAAYHFTSGDRSAWADWRDGERFVISGSRVERVRTGPRTSGHGAYRSWLQYVFRYAGTRSLRLDTDPVPEESPLRAGDLFVEPGSPGHAVVVLDIAENASGRRVALMGQGFMPAEEFHVLELRHARVLDGVWFALPGSGEMIVTPSWRPFRRKDARRFR